jgi:hypothetical protein
MKALSSSKKPTSIIISSAIVAILIGISSYIYFANRTQNAPTNPQDTSTIKQEQVPANSQSQSDLPSKTGDNPAQTNPTIGTPSTPPEKPTVERAGGDPTIKVVATFQKASPGHCELQLSQPGQQALSYTSKIVISSSYYTCSFTVSRATLPTSGSWSAVVIHHIGTAFTRSDAKELE